MEDKIQEYSEKAERGHHLISNNMTYIPVLDISLNLFKKKLVCRLLFISD